MQVVARVPELRDLVAHALGGLGATAELVKALTVLGDEADLRLLADLASVADAHQALGPAVTSGLVDLSADRVRVTHALIREAVYTSMHPHRRVQLHRRAALALESRSDGASLAGEIARHWWQTDTPAPALPWAVRAAEAAAEAGAHALAAAHLRRTIEFLDSVPGGGQADGGALDVVTVLLELARNSYLAGDVTASLEACERVTQEATRRGDWVTVARAALVIQGVNDPHLTDTLARLATTALRHLEQSDDEHLALQARLEAQLARTTEDGDDMAAWASLALEHATRSGDADSELDALVAQWPLLHRPGHAEQRLEAGRRVITLAQATNRPLTALWGHTWRVDGAMELCDVELARAETAEIDELAQRLPLPIIRWHALRLEAAWAIFHGDFDRAEQCSNATVEVSTQLGDVSGLGIHTAFLLAVTNLRGVEQALPAEFVDLMKGAPSLPVVQASRAMALWCAGRRDEAAAALKALPLQSIDLRVPTSLAMALYGTELALHLNDADACQALADLFRPIHATSRAIGAGTVLWYGSTARTLGRLQLALGSTDAAIHLLEEGLGVDESIGARPYVALGRWALATALRSRGRPTDLQQAAELARLAHSEAQRLAMVGLRQDTSVLLNDLAGRPTGTSPLTARENEIVALVLEAKSNRAIAEQLYLSERTVEGHVRNILAKTGATSRSELIRYFLLTKP
jgi:DNA-binding CsgD family transcriptional regulator